MISTLFTRKSVPMLAIAALAVAAASFCYAGGATIVTGNTTQPSTSPDGHERHPEIHAALRHLREAKRNLELAAHDYDGHRATALKDADAAIAECEAALKVDPK